jgi:hypothetical protein
MARESSYLPPVKGLATSFAEPSLPPEFALLYDNMHQDQSGGAEKRRGLVQIGNTIAGNPTITDITDLVDKLGARTKFAAGGGKIYKYDGSSSWDVVYTFPTQSASISSVQMSGKLIYFNGADPNVFTEDGTTFTELRSLIEVGELSSPSSATSVYDVVIASGDNGTDGSWLIDSNVTTNDLVHNVDLNAFGIINAVTSGRVDHTVIGSAGVGGTGLGLVDETQTAGQRYEIIDLVELNILPTNNPNDLDNLGTAGPGTSAAAVFVSGVTFSDLDIKVGDWVRNTTLAAATQVTSIATSIGVHGVSGQASGDTIILLKQAAPIIQDASVHYGRLYAIDARDRRKIRISSPNNPQDFTTDGATLDINDFPINSTALDKQSFDAGALQPEGDILLSIDTFQRFLVLLGRSKAYFYEGTEPVGSAKNITPIGLYPQGCVNRLAGTNLGNDYVYVTPDGVRAVQLNQDASTFNQTWLSNQLDTTLRDLIAANTGAQDIQLIYYRKRSWLFCKIGDEIYIYNFAPITLQGRKEAIIGSWHKFTGGLARQTAFYVEGNTGNLFTGSSDGKISQFDTNVYTDNGEVYKARLRTGWLNMKEPKVDVRTREGIYIKPQFVAGGNATITVSVEAPYNRESSDSATFDLTGGSVIGVAVIGNSTIGGSPVSNQKYPLHWRGETARFTFENEDSIGPVTLSRYTIYWVEKGRR